MLTDLELSALAIVDQAGVRFGAGLNVITGESGTGKSMLLGALGLLTGARARTGMVRSGSQRAELAGRWIGAPARRAREVLGLGAGDELWLRRRLGSSAKAWAGGRVVSVGALRQVGEVLVERAGQRSWTSLLVPEGQRAVLDRSAGSSALLQQMASAHRVLVAARRDLELLRRRAAAAAQQRDWLRFQLAELEALAIRPGADDEALAERERLAHAADLARGADQLGQLLVEADGCVLEALGSAERTLGELASWDPDLAPLLPELASAIATVEEIARQVGPHVEALEDPRRLDELEDQLAALRALERKHGVDGAALAGLEAELRTRLELAEDGEHAVAGLASAVEAAETTARAVAERLSACRVAAAGPLRDEVEARLGRLAMPHAELEVAITRGELGEHGHDVVELLLAANPGEQAGPLAEVASGGELGRVALALRLVLGSGGCTWVLDEVDAGLGGHAAAALGEEVRALAIREQVLLITHQPRLAALADHHVRVVKEVADGRTASTAEVLDTAGRVRELQRMLGGDRASEAFARGLLLSERRPKGRKGASAA